MNQEDTTMGAMLQAVDLLKNCAVEISAESLPMSMQGCFDPEELADWLWCEHDKRREEVDKLLLAWIDAGRGSGIHDDIEVLLAQGRSGFAWRMLDSLFTATGALPDLWKAFSGKTPQEISAAVAVTSYSDGEETPWLTSLWYPYACELLAGTLIYREKCGAEDYGKN